MNNYGQNQILKSCPLYQIRGLVCKGHLGAQAPGNTSSKSWKHDRPMRPPEATVSKSVQPRGLSMKLKCLRNDFNYSLWPEAKLGVVPWLRDLSSGSPWDLSNGQCLWNRSFWCEHINTLVQRASTALQMIQ